MAKKLPDGWRTTYCAFISEGYTHKDAADATGIASGTVRRHLQEDEELRELYQEARETVRDKVRNRVWSMGMGASPQEVDAATTRWALDHLIKWNLPEARETQHVEISGDPDKPVLVTHQRGLTLADLIADPRAARLVEQARRQLPAAPEVLAEPDRSLDPASNLPPGPVA